VNGGGGIRHVWKNERLVLGRSEHGAEELGQLLLEIANAIIVGIAERNSGEDSAQRTEYTGNDDKGADRDLAPTVFARAKTSDGEIGEPQAGSATETPKARPACTPSTPQSTATATTAATRPARWPPAQCCNCDGKSGQHREGKAQRRTAQGGEHEERCSQAGAKAYGNFACHRRAVPLQAVRGPEAPAMAGESG